MRTLAVRLGPSDRVPECLIDEMVKAGVGGAALVTAVGSLRSLTYVTAILRDGAVSFSEPVRVEEAIEVGSLVGHLGRDAEANPGFHLHGVFALEDGQVVAGHVLEARVLATLEVTLLLSNSWLIKPEPPGKIMLPLGDA